MDFELYFCADGVLRAKWSDKKPMLPLSYIQEQSPDNENDFRFMAKWWDSITYFEEGLTVGTFLEALKPWANFWSDYTRKDINAYIEEVRKPFLVKSSENEVPNKDEKSHKDIDWISLLFKSDLTPEVEYKRDKVEEEDILAFLNKPSKVRLTGQWELGGSYHLSGYVNGFQEHFGIDGSPLNQFANTPLYLNDKHIIHILDYKIASILTEEEKLFHKKSYGLRSYLPPKSKQWGDHQSPPIEYIQTHKVHTLQEIVKGFFDWFSYSPVEREDFNDSLREQLSNIDREILEDEEVETNVIDISTGKQLNALDKEQTDDIETDKKIKVKVAPGAFSSIIESMQSRDGYWDALIDKTKNTKVVKRIGVIKEGIPPENRIYGYIVEEKDLKTPYKTQE